jgi:rare lipoprotein A (peptidoglycan hydrolase)
LYVVPRRRLVFAVWLTALALPILVIDNIPRTEARAASVKFDAAHAPATPTTSPTVAFPADALDPTTSSTTTVTAPPTTALSAAPASAPAAPPKTTTTTVPPTTTTAPPNVEQGGASWYAYNPGECAHRTLPKGTVVTVTSLATGASVTCVVTDRGPYDYSRVIDLDRDTFAQLADPARGVIQVQITW